jgi:hypothetical protein
VLTVRPNVKYQAVLLAAVIDFEGGSRYQCELTDVDPKAVAIASPPAASTTTSGRRGRSADRLRYCWSLRQYPVLLQLVPCGQAPSGFPCESVAQSAGFDPSGGMHFRPSPGMVPAPGCCDEPTHCPPEHDAPAGQFEPSRQPAWH